MEGGIQYFRDLLAKHVEELKGFCKKWEEIGREEETVPEEVTDEIRTTVCLTNLLLRQKLKQFGDLIDDSEFKRSEKEISCIDLQGFWDMVFQEVEKIQKSFQKLEKCRSNKWVFVQEQLPTAQPKKKLKNKPSQATTAKTASAVNAHAAAAKQRLAEFKKKMREMNGKNKMVEDGILDTEVQEKKTVSEAAGDQEMANGEAEEKNVENGISNMDVPLKEQKPVLDTEKDIVNEEKVKSSKRTDALKSNKKTTLPQVSGKQKKTKYEKKGKENVKQTEKELLTVPVEKLPTPRTKQSKSKEVTPLQCVTRSAARRALLNK